MHGNSVILFCWLCTLPNCCWYFSMIFWPLQTYWNNSIYQLKKYRDIIKLLLLLSFFPPFWTNIRRLQIVSQKVYGLLISHWCFCENSFPLHFLFWFILKGLNNWETCGEKNNSWQFFTDAKLALKPGVVLHREGISGYLSVNLSLCTFSFCS